MTKIIKENIQELYKILKEDNFKVDEALEFLDAIKDGVDDFETEYDELKNELSNEKEKVSDLQSEINSLEDGLSSLNTIECGIDVIKYETPGNLVLQDIMENLENSIKKHTPKKVSEILAALN